MGRDSVLVALLYQLQSDYVDKEQQQIHQLHLHFVTSLCFSRLHPSVISTTLPGITQTQHCPPWDLGMGEE